MRKLSQVVGVKIGMTQVFDAERNVVPVTVIDCGRWYITQVKTEAVDGYNALQIGKLKDKFAADAQVDRTMLARKAHYFGVIREVAYEGSGDDYVLGAAYKLDGVDFDVNTEVSATGVSIGRGYQGVVKRWGFVGGPATHGSMFGRRPGAIGHMRTQGEVIKGKKLPGHMGAAQVTVQGLQVVRVDNEQNIVLIKGSVPGKKNTIIHLRKQG